MAKTTAMTKSARNELIKLRATFLNNVAVGLAVGGALVPYFALMPRVMSVGFWFSDYVRGAEPRIAIHVTDWIAIVISVHDNLGSGVLYPASAPHGRPADPNNSVKDHAAKAF